MAGFLSGKTDCWNFQTVMDAETQGRWGPIKGMAVCLRVESAGMKVEHTQEYNCGNVIYQNTGETYLQMLTVAAFILLANRLYSKTFH